MLRSLIFLLGCGAFVTFSLASSVAATAQPATDQPDEVRNGSYIGLGAAIGLEGRTTALGTGGVAVLSKVKFTDNLSLHDATVLLGGGVASSMIILTGEVPIRNSAGQTVATPFLGGGALVRYQDGLSISPAISGGVDVPVSRELTGTVRLNVGFPGDRPADVGVLVGVGYNLGR
jgi:opacity protein-like surface antigen